MKSSKKYLGMDEEIISNPSCKEALSDHPKWYLVQCKPREIFRAEEHLNNQEFACFHPAHKVFRSHANRKILRTESLFPHYLFVSIRVKQSFAKVNAT